MCKVREGFYLTRFFHPSLVACGIFSGSFSGDQIVFCSCHNTRGRKKRSFLSHNITMFKLDGFKLFCGGPTPKKKQASRGCGMAFRCGVERREKERKKKTLDEPLFRVLKSLYFFLSSSSSVFRRVLPSRRTSRVCLSGTWKI